MVELLVVLALLGLIAITISGGIRFGASVWERTEGEAEGGEIARGGQTALRDLLARLYPRERDPNASDSPPTFAGDKDRMEFLAMTPAIFDPAGVVHVVLEVQREREGTSLWMTHRSESGPPDEQRDRLLSGARDISFAYGQIKDGALTWNDNWDEQSGVPALIRVRAVFPPGSGVHWPDLIVRPRLDKDATCIYDAVSFGCRRG